MTKLSFEWQNHPCLSKVACRDVQQLTEYLQKVHYSLKRDDAGVIGYLYQKQIEMNNNLKEELKLCQEKLTIHK